MLDGLEHLRDRCFSTSFSHAGLAGLDSSNPIVTSLNGLPGRWHAQIFIDDLSKTELPELLGDCVRDFRYVPYAEVA